jgi:RNA polymerase sigma factor (sigma-70 family)
MRFRNNGKGEDNVTQNGFTAYLQIAVKRRKITYLNAKTKLEQHEITSDFSDDLARDDDWETKLHYSFQVEDAALTKAMEQLGERELLILLAVALDEQEFADLGKSLGLTYKGVSSAYYRIIRKLRTYLGGGRNEL